MDVAAPQTLKTPAELAAAGLISTAQVEPLSAVAARYAIAVPPAIAALIETSPQRLAIARQFLPAIDELHIAPEERSDPIGDLRHSPVTGIVHRYPDRVLLMPTAACAVYCRFCFRRETVGVSGGLTSAELAAALDYIRRTPAIWEVILTGGDPMIISTRRLGEIMAALDKIEHVKILRIHTRVPVATPERIDSALIATLKRSRKTVYVAIHCNHAAELTAAAVDACGRLADAGIPLLAQSVLLKGVNDSVETLEALMRALVAARIKPYYLHQLDLAPGTSHFRVPLEQGQALVKALRGRLSGIAQPTYILDIPGGAGKVPAGAGHISPEGDGTYLIENATGEQHTYSA